MDIDTLMPSTASNLLLKNRPHEWVLDLLEKEIIMHAYIWVMNHTLVYYLFLSTIIY